LGRLNYGRLMNNVRCGFFRFQQLVLRISRLLQANEEAENAIAAYLFEQASSSSLEPPMPSPGNGTGHAAIRRGADRLPTIVDSQRALVVQQDALAESRGTGPGSRSRCTRPWVAAARYQPNGPNAQKQSNFRWRGG
jgi:hypothetical protein